MTVYTYDEILVLSFVHENKEHTLKARNYMSITVLGIQEESVVIW
jgi:hypothetical protein